MLSSEDVKHVLKLANLPLTTGKVLKFRKQLDETLDYVKILEELDTAKEKPTTQVTGLENVYMVGDGRQKATLGQGEALSNAKRRKRGLFETEVVVWE